jgi:hypothetical protein
VACAVLALALLAPPARASTEEFESFDVLRPEEDDESTMDHLLTRFPADWRDEWEGAPLAFRTAQGCLTSGTWFQIHDLKLRSALGRRSRLDLELLQHADNEATYEWIQFDFRFPMPAAAGTWGVRFRPAFDKSRHDFGVLWSAGHDSSRVQVTAALGLEDGFNELWEFRQTRVGNDSRPYERHPLEPEMRVVWRSGDAARAPHARPGRYDDARGARVEVGGRWFTPARQRLESPALQVLERSTLWGARGDARAEARWGRWAAEAAFDVVQAASSRTVLPAAEDGRTFRRRWALEGAARVRLARDWTAEARWVHQERVQHWRPPAGNGQFAAVERTPVLELGWRPAAGWGARVGYMRDRVTVDQRGALPGFTYGTRNETRIHLGLQARFGRVLVQGVEGVELDREPYEVSFHHDKGFLQLQTTF